jgi:hypothetical protein
VPETVIACQLLLTTDRPEPVSQPLTWAIAASVGPKLLRTQSALWYLRYCGLVGSETAWA